MSPMQKVVEKTKQMASASASNINQVSSYFNGLKNNIKSTTAQQQLLINKLNDLKATISIAESDPKLFSKTEVIEMRAEVERLEKRLGNLQGTSKRTGNNLKQTFEVGARSMRRFFMGMLSVESIFSLMSRSLQSYLATNEEANAQYQITSNVLGQVLAPVMQMMLNLIQYLAIGIALLIKMFTGFDALAKVTTKNISQAGKETKKLNKELTAMDEITNIGDQATTGINLTADLNALADFKNKIAEVQLLFDKWNIQGFVDKLKDLFNWLWKNKELVIAVGLAIGGVFAFSKVSEWISSIGKLIGFGAGASGGSGLAGLVGLLKFIGTIGVITIGVNLIYGALTGRNLIDDLKEMNKAIQENGGWWKNWKDGIKIIFDSVSNWWKNLWKLPEDKKAKGNFSISVNSGLGGGGYGFATGGVVNQPTYGLMGEYAGATSNPEIISPQNIMKQTMMEAFSQILPQMQSSNSSGNTILYINGREFAKATQSDFEYENNRLGKSTVIRRV